MLDRALAILFNPQHYTQRQILDAAARVVMLSRYKSVGVTESEVRLAKAIIDHEMAHDVARKRAIARALWNQAVDLEISTELERQGVCPLCGLAIDRAEVCEACGSK